MFQKLRNKWGVSPVQLVLVLCTFIIGGSLCGWAGRSIRALLGIEHGALKVLLTILFATILWPVCVLLVSIPLGQFRFFTRYIARLGQRIFMRKKKEITKPAPVTSMKQPEKSLSACPE